MKQVDRIKTMENYLDNSSKIIDKLDKVLKEYEDNYNDLIKLFDYYGSSLWMKDYEDDEKGKLPAKLKRGVLSEDLIYDLLIKNSDITYRLSKIVTNSLKNKI